MNKKIIIPVLAIVILAVAGVWGYFWYQNTYKPDHKYQTQEFSASITKIQNNTVYASGIWRVKDTQGNLVHFDKVDAQIQITAQTKFTKTSIDLPTTAEQEKMGGSFVAANLKRDTKTVSQAQFVADTNGTSTAIVVQAPSNIYNRTKFTASEINYMVPVVGSSQ